MADEQQDDAPVAPVSDYTYTKWLRKNKPAPVKLKAQRYEPEKYIKGKTIQQMKAELHTLQGVSQLVDTKRKLFPSAALKTYHEPGNTVLFKSLDDPESGVYTQLNKYIPKRSLKWDEKKQMWVGTIPKFAIQKHVQRVEADHKSFNRGKSLLQFKMKPTQIDQQLPQMVKQILLANDYFGLAGIGPISKGGIPLYAGRYWNPLTNRIDLLPKISNKLVNPLSLNQKIHYLQGRVLNKWNQYVRQTQTLINFTQRNKNTQIYAKQQAQKLQKQFMKGTPQESIQSKYQFVQKIKNLIIKYITFTLPSFSPYYVIIKSLLTEINKRDTAVIGVMFQLDRITIKRSTPYQVTAVDNFLKYCSEFVDANKGITLKNIQQSGDLDPASRQRQLKKYTRAFNSINPYGFARIANSVITMHKMTIPTTNIGPQRIESEVRDLQRIKDKLAYMSANAPSAKASQIISKVVINPQPNKFKQTVLSINNVLGQMNKEYKNITVLNKKQYKWLAPPKKKYFSNDQALSLERQPGNGLLDEIERHEPGKMTFDVYGNQGIRQRALQDLRMRKIAQNIQKKKQRERVNLQAQKLAQNKKESGEKKMGKDDDEEEEEEEEQEGEIEPDAERKESLIKVAKQKQLYERFIKMGSPELKRIIVSPQTGQIDKDVALYILKQRNQQLGEKGKGGDRGGMDLEIAG